MSCVSLHSDQYYSWETDDVEELGVARGLSFQDWFSELGKAAAFKQLSC